MKKRKDDSSACSSGKTTGSPRAIACRKGKKVMHPQTWGEREEHKNDRMNSSNTQRSLPLPQEVTPATGQVAWRQYRHIQDIYSTGSLSVFGALGMAPVITSGIHSRNAGCNDIRRDPLETRLLNHDIRFRLCKSEDRDATQAPQREATRHAYLCILSTETTTTLPQHPRRQTSAQKQHKG